MIQGKLDCCFSMGLLVIEYF